ncbi:hypothetical protein OS493_039498, partial [Desmophyllum pertusum]
MRYWGKACAVLTCLLGTTWLLGLFFLGKASVVMAYLFNIFNVLQLMKGFAMSTNESFAAMEVEGITFGIKRHQELSTRNQSIG